jgi:hypothetical protein
VGDDAQRLSPKREVTRGEAAATAVQCTALRSSVHNDLVFEKRPLAIYSLCNLDVPQTLNNKLLALSALVNILDVIYRRLAHGRKFQRHIISPVVVSKWLVAS